CSVHGVAAKKSVAHVLRVTLEPELGGDDGQFLSRGVGPLRGRTNSPKGGSAEEARAGGADKGSSRDHEIFPKDFKLSHLRRGNLNAARHAVNVCRPIARGSMVHQLSTLVSSALHRECARSVDGNKRRPRPASTTHQAQE